MNIALEIAQLAQKAVLAQMLELCLYDFSEFSGEDLDVNGRFGYRYLDAYWTEDGRYPFLIKADGKLAGFVLVRSCSEYNDFPNPHNIAEFFVLKKYRRKGIGKAAAKMVFDLFSGGWEVSCLNNNYSALQFWERVVAEYTKGVYSSFAAEKTGFTFDNAHR